jgi:thymidine kinase
MKEDFGHVTVFTGPMFSGKSMRLIQQANSAERGGKEVLAVKPEIDTRDSDQIVTSLHDPVNGKGTEWSYGAVRLVSESEKAGLRDLYANTSPDVLIIDEVQFFDDWIVDFIRTVQKENSTEVYISGLDQTAWREPFAPTPDLLALADHVKKLQADCFVSDCSRKARFTQLTEPKEGKSDDSRIIVGGQETYQARCGNCWQHPDKVTS